MKGKTEATNRFTRRDFLKTTAGAGAVALAGVDPEAAAAPARSAGWDREADVVIIGSGATGMPAAIAARQKGASVIVVEANSDVGGHAIICTGNVNLGGGTAQQKQYGVVDSPDLLFSDLTDWSFVQSNGFPTYRYNDREIIRAFADNAALTWDFLVANGVTFVEQAPTMFDRDRSAARLSRAAPMDFPLIQLGKPVDASLARTSSSGIGLMRPLEASARKLGVEILLRHRMTAIIREQPFSGRVLGIAVSNEGKTLRIRARKGVIIGTGGSTSNVNFRRMFDPRLTEEYCGTAGEPYTTQDASGEIAAMAVGAALWGVMHQISDFSTYTVTRPGYIGCQYGYGALMPSWQPSSPIFDRVRALGLRVTDYQNLIMVNKAGVRFYNEAGGTGAPPPAAGRGAQPTGAAPPAAGRGAPPTSPTEMLRHNWRNAANLRYSANEFLDAAMAGVRGEAVNGGGPIWAIFDSEAVTREKWTVAPPSVDMAQGFFFSGATLEELAGRMAANKYQGKPIPAAALQGTVARYNSLVDSGTDEDFGKPKPQYKIQTPPFYAAWATPVPHDTRVGLRINARCEVVDLQGHVIPGLYCGGESAGGFNEHGVARCTAQGRIAGLNAAAQPSA